jgi:nitrous oxidase accessory protein NosD
MSFKRTVVGAAIAVALLAAAPAGADRGAIFVDDDRADCPHAEAQSIQLGVLLAEPDDTVVVCAGHYDETVTIAKPLRLNGEGPDPSIRVGDPTQEAVVEPTNRIGFQIRAPDVVVEGFTFRRADIAVTVQTLAGGFEIRKNLFVQNNTGLDIASRSDRRNVVEENDFRLNRRFGIFNNNRSGPLQNTRIAVNDFEGNQSSISVAGQVTRLVIDNNTFFQERGGGVLVTGAETEITHNDFLLVTQPIRASGFANRVAYNHIERGRVAGIQSFGGNLAEVEANRVVETQGDAIALQNFRMGTVRGNHLSANGRHGLRLFNGSEQNLVELNFSYRNGGDGILLEETTGANRIENNRFDDNAEHDCHDDTVGPGTGGTRNIWIHNLGDTSNRPGICEPTGTPQGEAPAPMDAAAPSEPCMPYAEARETSIESSVWDAYAGVCDPTAADLAPAPEGA